MMNNKGPWAGVQSRRKEGGTPKRKEAGDILEVVATEATEERAGSTGRTNKLMRRRKESLIHRLERIRTRVKEEERNKGALR